MTQAIKVLLYQFVSVSKKKFTFQYALLKNENQQVQVQTKQSIFPAKHHRTLAENQQTN